MPALDFIYVSASSISLSGEAGKPGFFVGRVGFPGNYHKYKTVK